MGTIIFEQYQISWVFGQVTAAVRAELIGFWARHGAVADAAEAWRRSFEVACTVRDAQGQLVGVSSLYNALFAGTGEYYWHYRTFIAPQARVVGMTPKVFAHTFDGMAKAFSGEHGAPVGLLFVTENPKLESAAGIRVIERGGNVRMGTDPTGKSLWHRRFKRPSE